MVAKDGPHYGENVKMMGPGKYRLTLTVAPPDAHFGRHVDKETGVAPWFKTFAVEYEFTYAGLEKRAPIERRDGGWAILLAALFLVSGAANTRAEEEPVFMIEFKGGNIAPERLEVPANRRFQLQLRNNGDTPAEFESNELRKEKLLAPRTTSTLVFRTLDPRISFLR